MRYQITIRTTTKNTYIDRSNRSTTAWASYNTCTKKHWNSYQGSWIRHLHNKERNMCGNLFKTGGQEKYNSKHCLYGENFNPIGWQVTLGALASSAFPVLMPMRTATFINNMYAAENLFKWWNQNKNSSMVRF